MRTSSLAVCAAAALFVVTTVAAQNSTAPAAGGATSPAQGASSTPGSTSKAQGTKRSMHVRQGQTRKQTFDRLDTNHDGMISREEAQADPDLIIIFVDADADKDGQLSPAEFIVVPITQEDGSAVK
jgi:Ca2+-binding EF-hand superfamily protein